MLEGEITCDYAKCMLEGLVCLNLMRGLNVFIKARSTWGHLHNHPVRNNWDRFGGTTPRAVVPVATNADNRTISCLTSGKHVGMTCSVSTPIQAASSYTHESFPKRDMNCSARSIVVSGNAQPKSDHWKTSSTLRIWHKDQPKAMHVKSWFGSKNQKSYDGFKAQRIAKTLCRDHDVRRWNHMRLFQQCAGRSDLAESDTIAERVHKARRTWNYLHNNPICNNMDWFGGTTPHAVVPCNCIRMNVMEPINLINVII